MARADDLAARKERVVPGINLAGGLEYQIAVNVSLPTEYDYSRFSSVHISMSSSFAGAQPTPDNFKVSPVLQMARLGVDYHF